MKRDSKIESKLEILPICVDLDGTLVATDTLYESFLALLAYKPLTLFDCLGWISKGKAVFKSKLSNAQKIDIENLPWNESLLDWLKLRKAAGHKIVLATAADQSIALAAQKHLGIFDQVFCSDGSSNLKGKCKGQALVHEFGERGFIYVGDSKVDLPVWRDAAGAVVVEVKDRLRKKVEACSPLLASFQSSENLNEGSFVLLRPKQWIKNLLVFVPIIASGQWWDLKGWLTTAGVFFAFSLVASGTYIINDLLDIQADRHHFKKKKRPIASGKISIPRSLCILFLTVASGFLIGWQLEVFPVIFAYVLVTLCYSLFLKAKFLLDVFALAFLYLIRIYAGADVADHSVSIWLFSFGMFVFLGLAMMKRVAELMKSEGSRSLRRRGYKIIDVNILTIAGICSAFASALILFMYFRFNETSSVFKGQQTLFLSVPVILYWQLRCWRAVEVGVLDNDPIAFATSDKPSRIILGILLIIIICARFGNDFYFPHLYS